ncbi:MAG: hypothetical protein WC994_09725 [Brumimicrobium sp.]
MRKWLIIHISVFIFSTFAVGQKLHLDINKESIQIGEPFQVTFSVISDEPIKNLQYTPQKRIFEAKSSSNNNKTSINSLYELEVLQDFRDSTYKENDNFIWKGQYSLTGWDSAYVIIPPEKIYISDSLFYFPVGLIEVTSPNANPSQPIYDIHEDFTEIAPVSIINLIKKYWFISLLIVLIIGYLIYRQWNKRKEKPEIELSLREKTLKEIDALENSRGFEQNLKEYYFDLSVILRRFFELHYQSPIMDKTTHQIKNELSRHGLDKTMVNLTGKLLNESDMVKFAKSKPSLNEILAITNDARRVVNEVADLELLDD